MSYAVGTVRSLDENIKECGERTLSEYTFYPYKSASAGTLPLEYCAQTRVQTICKLLVGWHMSKQSTNNFEYLKDDVHFKNYFMDSTAKEPFM